VSGTRPARTRIGGVDVGDEATRGALVASTWDGAFATVMIGVVETFGVAAAVALGVSAVPIALLGPLPVWLGTLAQLGLRRRLAGRPRKPWVVGAVRIQATLLFAVALAGCVPQPWAAPAYVAAFVLYGASNAAVGHLWMSWISDVCPSTVLGRHMAWRSTIFACVQLVTTGVAGWLARGFSNETAPWTLYATAFAVAGVARFASAQCLAIQLEPPPVPPPPTPEAFRPSVALARFAPAIALLQGSALLAGPFFAVWFLRDLGFTYLEFAIAGACTIAGQLLANRFVGRLADELGAARVLRFGALSVALVPLPYLWISSPWAVWLANFYSGMAWAAVNLTAFKYLVQASRGGADRSGFVYANVWLTSTVLVLGLLGGVLAPHLPRLFAWPLQSLFLVSGLLRLAVAVGLFPRLIDLEPVDRGRQWGPGRLFQVFRWGGPGTSRL
jgi:MFS family permease